jgi:oxygen-independent coproporphyrinogen-3 oxidase
MISPGTFARYAAMRVPRYTSYPTAPQFTPEVDAAQYGDWLSQVPAGGKASLYLHIPFCRAMCWYCGCHTSVTRRAEPVERYVDALCGEIALVAGRLPDRLAVGHLHWGGGSPTLLAPAATARIDSALRAVFDFDHAAEQAVEVDPRTLTREGATAFAAAGVNRASLGVQSFDPKVQAAINRVQSFETTAEAVAMLREAGIGALNFDLIYGLPFETAQSCVATVEQALALRPDRLAVFGYAHVPSFKPHQRKIDEAALPNSAERHAQAEAIARTLTGAGYRQIGLDHFALPGDSLAIAAEQRCLRRNFQGYTVDACATMLGFGASAIGRVPGGFAQNATRIPDYEKRIADGLLATARGCPVSGEDERRSAIIEQLMCNFRAETDGLAPAVLNELESDGLIRRLGGTIEVAADARPLVRAVAAAFDAYLPTSTARHVAAV